MASRDASLRAPSARAKRLLWALPAVVAVLAFSSGLAGGFVQDDRPAILENGAVNGALPLGALLTRTFWGTPLDSPPPVWRPLASLVFRVELSIFGASPLAFHVVSLLFYVAALHVAQRLARVWLDARAACAATCVFAAMPLHVENVTSAVGQADLLGLGLGLGALLVLRPLLEGGTVAWARLGAASAAYVAAVLCKESAATLPLVVIAFATFAALPGDAGARRSRFVTLGTFAAVGAAYVALRMSLVPATLDTTRVADDVLAGAGPWSRVVFSAELVAGYARLVALPVDLCVGRKYAEVARPHGLGVGALVGLAIVGVAAWRTALNARQRRAPLLLAAAITWLLFSSLFFSPPEAMADRFMLYPTYFVALALARGVRRVPIDARLLGVIAGAVVLTEAALAAAYARAWRTDEALLASAVAACPDSVHDHYRLARLLAADGDAESAVWHFAVASQGRGAFPEPWHHPAAAEEATLSPAERVRTMHALLRVAAPEAVWRAWLAASLRAQGMESEARVVERPRPR